MRRVSPGSTGAGTSDRPERIEVQIGGAWLPAAALASRVGRRGKQVLVSCHGRLIWVTATRTRRPL